MSVKHIIAIIVVAVTYLFFSNQFFSFSEEIKTEKISGFSKIRNFAIVYIWFVFASVMEFPLVINWSVFLCILGVQVYSAFSFKLSESYELSLFCVILGLAVNVFCRSVMAIMLDKPLDEFDNSLSEWKTYPIALGFFVVAVLFRVLRYKGFPTKLNLMLQDRRSFRFYFLTEMFIFLFLCVQLLTYSQSTNEMGIKMWGIKSALFAEMLLLVGIIYALRVASLHYYRNKEYANRDKLIQDKRDVNNLWSLAYTDMLTGCNNRQLLEKRLTEYARYGGDITLAFVDLNGLKKVNDQYGHIEGDCYLKKVAQILMESAKVRNIDVFRYGGDEYIMLSNALNEQEISEILKSADDTLKAQADKYPCSISYGVVHGNSDDYQKLIDEADKIMYDYKTRYYKCKQVNRSH